MAAEAKEKSKSSTRGLGRGLGALLGDGVDAANLAQAPTKPQDAGPNRVLPIEYLKPNPNQPRRSFDANALEELAHSISARGLLQPILVRPISDDVFEIVAGERRWRAAQRANLHEVPVVVQSLSDEEAAEIALIENVQRVDLNPIEEAEGYHRLVAEFSRTQNEIAKAVGKSRSHIANLMRLTNLPEIAQTALRAGHLTMGHARALLAADDPIKACERVLSQGLSVRQTEALVRPANDAGSGNTKKPASTADKTKPAGGDADTRALAQDLAAALGLEVEIAHSKSGAGAVTIRYLDLDQLDDMCARLMAAGV